MVYLVTDSAWSVAHHPKVRCFRTLADAVAAIVAADAGERSRIEMLAGPRGKAA